MTAAARPAKTSTCLDLSERLERVRRYLHDHLHRGVTLDELAAVALLSPFHLARWFKHAFGEAPIAYHRGLRLNRAAERLAATRSLAEAAEAAGYSDEAALCHAFRRHFGCAPRQWAAARAA